MMTHYPNSPCYLCGGSLQTLRAADATLNCCTSCGTLITKRKDTPSYSSAFLGNSSGRSRSSSARPVEQAACTRKRLIKRSATSSAASIAASTVPSGHHAGTAAFSGREGRNSTATAGCTFTPSQLHLPMTLTASPAGTSGTNGGTGSSVAIASKRHAARRISPVT